MPFTVQMTGTNEIPVATLQLLGASFEAPLQNRLYTQITALDLSANEDRTSFKFGRILPISLTAGIPLLDEYEDPDSVALTATTGAFNAVEVGRVVTTTSRAEAISGGNLGRQAAAAVGNDAANVLDLWAITTLAGGTNAMFAGSAGTSAGLTASDVLTPELMNRAYRHLAKAGAQKDADGYYTAILSTDQIYDLKNATGAGSWLDVFKYADPTTVMRGEVGRAFGFKVLENNGLAPVNQASGTNDVTRAVFFGAGAVGRGVAVPPRLGIAFTDKMNRFAHYSWYANMIMGLPDQSRVFVISTATSLGANAA